MFCEIPTQNKEFAKRSGWYVQWKGASFCDCSMLVREGGERGGWLWQQTTEGVRSHHTIVATVAMLISCVKLPKYIYILNSLQIARLVEFLSCTDMLTVITRSPHNIKLKLNACLIPWSKLIEQVLPYNLIPYSLSLKMVVHIWRDMQNSHSDLTCMPSIHQITTQAQNTWTTQTWNPNSEPCSRQLLRNWQFLEMLKISIGNFS